MNRKGKKMQKLKMISVSCMAVIFTFAITACAPTVATRGNLVADSKLEQIKPYYATKYDVQDRLGPPSAVAPFEENTWYYIGSTSETMGIFKEEVIKQRILAVKFDEYDTVMEITELDPNKAQEFEIVERKTPTAGKDFTFIQQLVGNVGRFNSIPGANQ